MSNAITTWELKFKDAITAPVEKVREIVDKAGERADNLGKCFKRLNAIDLQAISQSAQNLNQRLTNLNQPFIGFESGLTEVSAITGITGTALDDLGKKARQSANDFGGAATDSLNNYKILLSRLGPDIAKSPEALEKMERNVRTLSKTMGNDAVGSVDALTTAMLQYGVDLSEPIAAQQEMERMMNIMAAGAKEGAAEVPSIAAALKVAGVQAKQSNVSFAETNAVLQALATGGKEGSEAGVALRNVLGKMAGVDVLPKEAAEKLNRLGVNMNIVSDTSLPLTTRLRELKKAQGDATIMAQMFGTENAAAASIMLNSVDAQDILKKKIEGTNVAQEQANIMMDTTAEKQSRVSAWYTNMKIAVGEYTTALGPFGDAFATGISIMADSKNAFEGYQLAMRGVKTMMGLTQNASMLTAAKTAIMTGVTGIATTAQWAWNAAMTANPIGLIIVGITALVGIIALAWSKFEGFRKVVFQGWEMLKLFGNTIKTYVIERFKGLLSGITGIGAALMHFFKGDWSKAWEVGKQATKDLIGVDAKQNALKNIKDGTPKTLATGKKTSDEYTASRKTKVAEQSAVNLNKKLAVAEVDASGINLKELNNTTTHKSGKKEMATATDGNNVSKSIVQNLTVNNHFGVSGTMDIRKVADDVVGLIIDRLRDGVIQLG